MNKLKKLMSIGLSLMIVTGTFVCAQLATAAEVKSSYSVTLGANGKNMTILTGAKNNANYNYSTISLTGGTVNHINAWVVNANGKTISDGKTEVEMGDKNKKIYYEEDTSAAKGATTSIVIEQNNVLSKTAKGNANLK